MMAYTLQHNRSSQCSLREETMVVRKVRIFWYHDSTDSMFAFEKEINEWLERNPAIEILETHLVGGGFRSATKFLIFYKITK